jgi:hypothetical protein
MQKIPKNIFTNDPNSPEGTELTNTHVARPEGSLVIYHFNPNNYSIFYKSIYDFITEAERKLLEEQAPNYFKKIWSESGEKQKNIGIFGTIKEGDQLLDTFSAKIDIHSILIDLPEEPDQTMIRQINIKLIKFIQKNGFNFSKQ